MPFAEVLFFQEYYSLRGKEMWETGGKGYAAFPNLRSDNREKLEKFMADNPVAQPSQPESPKRRLLVVQNSSRLRDMQ